MKTIKRLINSIYRIFKGRCMDCMSRSSCKDYGCSRKVYGQQWWMKF